ncbi:MAG: hypothetical protein FJX46_12820, partial [Alphaproteobacteria bacterium]|nr:hypothetical protein [Alphaproteobacteria bacterium]
MAMAESRETKERAPLLPPEAARFLANRVKEIAGLGLIGLAAAFGAALATHSPADPSHSVAAARA